MMLNEEQCLHCENCNEKYGEPKLLPCGFTVCAKCVTSLTNNDKLACKLCAQSHAIPKEGFPINPVASSLLANKDTNSKLADAFKQLAINNFSVRHSQDQIKSRCADLRRLVKTRYDEVLDEINSLNQLLNTKINECENEWLENHKTLEESKLSSLKSEITKLHSDLNNVLQQKTQLNQALSSNLSSVSEKVSKALYGSKQVEFKRNSTKIDSDFLGELNVTETINLNSLKQFNLDDQLNDFADNIFFANNPNGLFFIAYQNESNKLIIITFDPNNGKLDKKAICNCKALYGITKSKTQIAIHLIMELDYDSLLIMDTNFKILHEKRISRMNLRGANDSYLYFSAENNTNNKFLKDNEPLKVFDWKLNKIDLKHKFQTKDPKAPFYVSDYLDQIDNRNGKYVLLFDNNINIVDENTGALLKSIQIETIYFIVDSNNNIIVFDEPENRLRFYDLSGNLVKYIYLDNFNEGFGFNIDKNDKLNFFDWTSNVIYYS